MTQSSVALTRLCGIITTLNMHEMMCEVAEYNAIEIDAYAKVVDVFTKTLMYHDLMLERNE